MRTSAESSFTHFLLVKRFVFVPLAILLAYVFISLFARGPALQKVTVWLALAVIGAGASLIVMYLWFRLGRPAWLVILVSLVAVVAVVVLLPIVFYFLMLSSHNLP